MASVERKPWIIKSIIKKESERQLGVYFDLYLLFLDHIAKIASKSQKIIASLAILVKTIKKVEAIIMRKKYMPAFYQF